MDIPMASQGERRLVSPKNGAPRGASPANNGSLTSTLSMSVRHQQANVHPFRYDFSQHAGVLQLIKMIVVGLFLFVPRLLILIFAFAMLGVAASMRKCCNAGRKDSRGLWLPIRGGTVSMFFMGLASRLIMFGFGYWWITVEDQRSEADKKSKVPIPVIAANHVSFLDAFYFAWAVGPMGVGKSELFKVPILGSVAYATQMIGVSREDSKKSHSAADEIKRRTRWNYDQPDHVLKETGTWPSLLIFPEATCTNTKSVIQFKLGAFIPMVPVQPVALDFRQSHLDVSWVDVVSPAVTALRCMCQVYNRATVTYLPVIRPDGERINTPTAFAKEVRAAIARTLNVPTTEHNFLDVLIAREVSALRLPRGSINVEMGQFSDKGALDRVKAALRQFAAIDKDKDGHLDETEFAVLLGFGDEAERIAHGSLISAAFAHWDRDGDGKINFREFLLLSSAVQVSKLTQKYQLEEQSRLATPTSSPDVPPRAGGGKRSPAEPGAPSSYGATAVAIPASPSESSSSVLFGRSQEPPDAPGVRVGGVVMDAPNVKEAMRKPPASAPINDELRSAFALSFSAFDKDNDGIIKRSEFEATLRRSAPSVALGEARALFHAAAAIEMSKSIENAASVVAAAAGDGEEVVTFEQYMRLCERYPVLVGSFLDAVAVFDGPSAPDEAAVGDEDRYTLQDISRHNSFVATGAAASGDNSTDDRRMVASPKSTTEPIGDDEP